LQQASDNVDVIGRYLGATTDFCEEHVKKLWLNLSECRTTIFDATRQVEKLKCMKNLAHQLTRTEVSLVRKKRGLFNFIG
jgi:predicted kinase